MLSSFFMARRRGLTLIEVIIALGIIVLLAGLLIPAISSARESARRTQCKNNMKQLGLALGNYESTFRTFPPGFVVGETGTYQGWGWMIFLPPYMDASPYYNGLNFQSGLQYESANPKLHSRQYHCFRCPSDRGSDHIPHTMVVSHDIVNGRVIPATVDAVNLFHRSNYFGVAGYLQPEVGGIGADDPNSSSSSEPHLNSGSLGNRGTVVRPGHQYCDPRNFQGVFGQNSSVGLRDLKDGSANTFLAGERYSPSETNAGATGHGTWAGVPDCSTALGLAMTLGDTSVRLNPGNRLSDQTTGFGSTHTGGAHMLLGDGSVDFVADSIDISLYRKMSTIADSERPLPD